MRVPVLYALSPVLVNRPPDRPEHVHITGHWESPTLDGWQPSAELEEFLQRVPAPIYLGFGSMALGDTGRTNKIILQALELCGLRAVLCGDLGKLPQQPGESDRIYREQYVPHGWLFPQVSCAVHHGSIGTTTMQLKAGLPAVIVPINFDQPFWADAVTRLGVAPAPIPYQQLTAESLAGAMLDTLRAADRRAPVLLYYERHADAIRLRTRGILPEPGARHEIQPRYRNLCDIGTRLWFLCQSRMPL